jgi:HK97 family phage portal protein
MSVIRRLTERRSLPTSIDPYQITARPFFPNYSGEIVTELTAFASTAVMSAVSLLADSVATMPVELTRQRAGRVEKLPTPSVLIKPNAHQTMFEFVHQTMLSLALHGCAYIYAPRRAGELPSEMRVLHPNLVKKAAMSDDGSSYVYSIDDQEYTGKDIRAIHWILLPNQVRAVSPLEAMRNTIGIGLAMDRFLSQFYGEGATPSSVLETEATITTEQAQVLRDTWSDAHTRRRRPAVLTGGLKWKPITTSAADSQMLEHREAIVRDIARAYRIPIHMINGSGGNSQTYQNIESAGTNFVRYTLLPFMRRIEDAISEMLPVTQHVRFNADEFMRADLITRVRAQQVQIMSGTLSPNEARQQENREPYEGGDQFIIGIAGSPLSGVEGDVDKPIIGVDAVPPER